MSPLFRTLALAAVLATLAPAAPAQQAEPLVVLATAQSGETVKARLYMAAEKLTAGAATKFAVVLDIAPGWHVNANPKGADFQVETAIAVKSQLGTELTAVKYPPGEEEAIPGLDVPLKVYSRRAIIYGTLTAPATAAGQTEAVAVGVRYQSCSEEGQCLAPAVEKLVGRLAVAAPGEAVKSLNAPLFKPLAAAPAGT